jgi:hypothetical protein
MSSAYFERLIQARPGERLQHLLVRHWIAAGLGVAAELGIADLLADGPRRAASWPSQPAATHRALYRLLRTLTSVGLFSEVNPERLAQ